MVCCSVQVCAVRYGAKSEHDPNLFSKYVEIGTYVCSMCAGGDVAGQHLFYVYLSLFYVVV